MKFEKLQNLMGLAIEQTTEQHSVINIRIGMQEKLNTVNEIIEDSMYLDYEYDQKQTKYMTTFTEGKNEAVNQMRMHDERVRTHTMFYQQNDNTGRHGTHYRKWVNEWMVQNVLT